MDGSIKRRKGSPTPSGSISSQCWSMVTLGNGLGSIFKHLHRPVLATDAAASADADAAARCGYNLTSNNPVGNSLNFSFFGEFRKF